MRKFALFTVAFVLQQYLFKGFLTEFEGGKPAGRDAAPGHAQGEGAPARSR